jgi:phosphofructokinase-like protein
VRIGVLTGGGDCPGLNPAIRAVVRRADQFGHEVLGVQNGWAGLLGEGKVQPLAAPQVSGILSLGGTILGTSRTNPFKDPAMVGQVLENLERHSIGALIAIGGDDTLSVAARLYQEQNQRVVGIPKTMDNDVSGTDYTIGFNSAVTIVADALDKLHTTASSHHRVLVVEVMGRDAGWVAVIGGLAGGADFILIPERPTMVDSVCRHLERRRAMGKDFSIIVVAEGAIVPDIPTSDQSETDAFGHVRLDRRNIGELVGREIERRTGFETRVTVLGHLQRGGSPSLFDRVLATRFGIAAVDYVEEGRFGYMPALRGTEIVPCKLSDAVARSRTVDLNLYELAQIFY